MPDETAVAGAARLTDADFDESYFAHHCGVPYRRDEHWLGFFTRIADRIVSDIGPRRVLDAGCAMGLLVERLRERRVDAYGFDLSSYAIARVPEPARPFCWQASVCDEIDGRYDLIACIEVLAHVTPQDAETAVANFCRHTGDVLFSASPVDPAVRRHVNVNPPEYYAGLFARHDFYRDFAFDASFVTPWAIRYRRVEGGALDQIRLSEQRLWETEQRLHETERALAEARETVARMRRSWFWKLRAPWARLMGR